MFVHMYIATCQDAFVLIRFGKIGEEIRYVLKSMINMVQSALVCSVLQTAVRKEQANHLNILRRPCPMWGEQKIK